MVVQVTDGEQVIKVSNGDEVMTRITATGCSVTAVACAFITVAPQQPLLATAFALAIFGCVFCDCSVPVHDVHMHTSCTQLE